jgi:hypothetical protein
VNLQNVLAIIPFLMSPFCRMFELLANFRQEMMLAPAPLPFPGPPACTLNGAYTENDTNGLGYLCYEKKLFSGVTPEPPAKGRLAVTVWSNGQPTATYYEGKGSRATVYENCPVSTTPEHRAYQISLPCTYVDPSVVPTDTVPFSSSW